MSLARGTTVTCNDAPQITNYNCRNSGSLRNCLGLGALPEEAGIMTMPRAEDWRRRGGYFSWRPAAEDACPVEVFHVELGDPGAPVLLLVHGWPTSSIDWFAVAGQLSTKYRVCALDFPGYGFSGKPQGWGYSLGAMRSSSSSTSRR